jgi:hypothetical protein
LFLQLPPAAQEGVRHAAKATAERGGDAIRVGEAAATYPAVAFWALSREPGRSFLLIPLSDVMDEHYSAYLEIAQA